MTVCSYYLRGQCRFGDRCKNEHPKDKQFGFGNNSWTAGGKSNTIQYLYTIESLSKDLSINSDKPLWSLSSFGPAKYEPNLISGIDESFEELRVKAILALKNNAVQEYVKYESDKIMAADQIYENGRNNIQQAYDQATQNTQAAGASSPASAFGSSGSTFGAGGSAFGSQPTSSTFGQPSAFGALGGNTPTFGTGSNVSAFGQSSTAPSAFSQQQQPTTSVFGQPSLLTSALGGSQTQTNPTFGQHSLIKPANGFGSNSGGGGFSAFAGQQPSAFGLAAANNTGGSVFGQPSNPPSSFGSSGSINTFGGGGATSVFGAPVQGSASAFGAPPSVSAFGTPAGTSVFGTPAQGNPPSVFGNPPTASAFGGGSTFGAPSAFGALVPSQQPVSSAFGVSTNPPSPFAVLGPGTSAFENTNNNAPISSFGVQNQSQPSAFGGPAASTSVFGSNQPSAFGSSSGSAFSNVDPPKPSGPSKPKTGPPDFQNAPSKYVPGASTNKYDALLPNNYADSLPASAREAFEAKKFEWGKVPEWIPPVEFR